MQQQPFNHQYNPGICDNLQDRDPAHALPSPTSSDYESGYYANQLHFFETFGWPDVTVEPWRKLNGLATSPVVEGLELQLNTNTTAVERVNGPTLEESEMVSFESQLQTVCSPPSRNSKRCIKIKVYKLHLQPQQ